MFKQLLTIFRKDTLLDQAYKRSYEMLDITHDMFIKAKDSLKQSETGTPDLDIRALDVKVNQYEREVRRNVFNHLAISGAEDIYSGLVLISIIIDIERVGDYMKNIVELAVSHPAKLELGKFGSDLKRVERAAEDTFVRVRKIFEKSDTQDAAKLLQEYYWINPLCDKIVISYIKEEDQTISSGDAVSLALYFRYLKRINSHLRNIATSVVNPFDRIGFVPKEMRQQMKK